MLWLVPRFCDAIACKSVFTIVYLLDVDDGREREQTSKQPCQAQVPSSCKLWTQPSMEQLAWITATTLNARLSFSSIQGLGQVLAIYLDAIGGTAENIYCQSETQSPDLSLGTVDGKMTQLFSALRNPTGMTLLCRLSIHLLEQTSCHRKMNLFIQLEQ